MLEKLTGKNKPLDILLKKLPKLNRIFPRGTGSAQITAEIVLNRNPYKNYKTFRDLMEDITGLKFVLTLIPTLGKYKLGRNYYKYTAIAIESDEILEPLGKDETEDECLNVRVSTRIRSSREEVAIAQVLLSSKPRTHLANQAVPVNFRRASSLAEDAQESDIELEHYYKPTTTPVSQPEKKQPKLIQGAITTVAKTSKKTKKQ
jgi:hypothetical protein